jgi:hypothetical protein
MSPIKIFGTGGPKKPGTPTNVTAVANGAGATVSFTPPSFTGVPAGTAYTVRVYNGTTNAIIPGITGTGSASPIGVSGLSYSTSYKFSVELSNGIYTSDVSALSAAITTPAPPFFPYFPFFPPFFPFFPPFFPFFPPFFPFFPGFGPTFPAFKTLSKCISAESDILTTNGYIKAKDIKIDDMLITIDVEKLKNIDTSSKIYIGNKVDFTEIKVVDLALNKKPVIKFNNSEQLFSPAQPIFIKNEENIQYKDAGEVVVGDSLLNINILSGEIIFDEVKNIQILPETDVYDIRTSPHQWFIVGNNLVIS